MKVKSLDKQRPTGRNSMKKWILAAVAILFVGIAWQVYENIPRWRAVANTYTFLSTLNSPDHKYYVDVFKSEVQVKDFTKILLRPAGDAIDIRNRKRLVARGKYIEDVKVEWKDSGHLRILTKNGELKLVRDSIDGVEVEIQME